MANEPDSARANVDWTRLPAEFAYLKGAAENFGHLMALGKPLERRITSRELKELRKIASTIGWHNHDAWLNSWMIERSIENGGEAVDLVEGLLVLLEFLGLDVSDYGPKEEPKWTLNLWDKLHYRVLQGMVGELRDVASDERAFEIAVRTLSRVPSEDLGRTAFFILSSLRTSQTLDWIEANLPDVVSPWHWGWLAAVSDFSWTRASDWIARGRPLSLVALDALVNMDGTSESPIVQRADPKLLQPPPFELAAQVLRDCAVRDPAPRVEHAANSILKRWSSIIGRQGRT